MTDDRQIYILRTSNDILNKFFINNNNLVLEEIKDGEVIDKKIVANNIKNYSAAIDKEDRIHIVYTNDNINLRYMVLPHMDNSVNIISTKQAFTLGCISIKTIDSIPHIFCAFIEKNLNKHIIYHNYLEKNLWKSMEIFESVAPKYIQPYLLEKNDDDIYILLCANHNEGKFLLRKFVSLKSLWMDVEESLVLEGCSNINFFVSPKNMAIIACNKLINKNFQSIIMYKDLNSKNCEGWRNLTLSDNDSNYLKPIIFCNTEEFYIIWVQGTKLVLKRSNNLTSWEEVDKSDINLNKCAKCFYMSNNIQDLDIKVNCIYLSTSLKVNPLINFYFKNYLLKEYLALDHGQSHVKLLESRLQLLDIKLQKKNTENSSMENQIRILNSVIDKYKKQVEDYMRDELSFTGKFNFQGKDFVHKILSLKEEKDSLILSFNKKLLELLRIIAEKDNLINELYKRFDK